MEISFDPRQNAIVILKDASESRSSNPRLIFATAFPLVVDGKDERGADARRDVKRDSHYKGYAVVFQTEMRLI